MSSSPQLQVPFQPDNDKNQSKSKSKPLIRSKTNSDASYRPLNSPLNSTDNINIIVPPNKSPSRTPKNQKKILKSYKKAKKNKLSQRHSIDNYDPHRSYTLNSMSDGNKREHKNPNKNPEFFRFPAPKTLHFRESNIGLYSPLVSSRIIRSRNQNCTIYDGVPSYLNPNLMKKRLIRAKSTQQKSKSGNNNNENITSMRSNVSKSQENIKYDIIDNNKNKNKNNGLFIARNHSKTLPNRESINLLPAYHSMNDLDVKDPLRERLHTEWSLYNDKIHSPDQHKKHNYAYSDIERLQNLSYVKTAPQKRLLEDFNTIWKRAYFALVILALMNGLLTWMISKAASQAWSLQSWIYENETFHIAHWAPSYLLELLIKLLFVLLAIALTRTFAPGSAGSGVPELRAILSGIWIRHYLSLTTFFIKIFALTLSLSSGVPIGLEGPFIHLSSIIGRQLTKLSFFSHLDRKQMLSAACAGGLASVFGAPIGGVLFSIEVTSTYYPVTNYWTAFCCAMVGSTFTHIFQTLSPTSLLLYETNFTDSDQPKNVEMFFFAGLGILAGIAATLFIQFHELYVDLRRKYQSRFLGDNPYGIAVVVIVFFTTILFFVGDFAIEPARKAVSDMFNIQNLENCDDSIFDVDIVNCDDVMAYDCNVDNPEICAQQDYCNCHYHDWLTNLGLLPNLIAFYVINFFYTICAVTLSYPCGLFSPIFTLGSVLGRIYGEVFDNWFVYCDPRVYSVVGAAAMAAGVTQTISPAVIALEITQDLSLAVPCLLAVICAGGVSGSLTHSFYDSVLQLRGIPMLPIRPTVAYKRILIKPRRRSISVATITSPKSLLSRVRSNSDSNSELDSQPEIFNADNMHSIQNDHMIAVSGYKKESISSSTSTIKPVRMFRLLIADDVMNKEFSFVPIDPTTNELVQILTQHPNQEWFPLVHSLFEAVLIGEIRRSVLMDYLKFISPNSYQSELPNELKLNHISFISQSKNQLRDKASLLGDVTLLNDTLINKNGGDQKEDIRKPSIISNLIKIKDWLPSSSVLGDGKEAIELDKIDDNDADDIVKDKNEDNSDEDTFEIKTTLMSSGFIERINLSPIQVISEMPLTKIYTLFHILKPQNVYVTKYSRLIGVINEVNLLKREFETQKTSKPKYICLKCNRFCQNKCRHSNCC